METIASLLWMKLLHSIRKWHHSRLKYHSIRCLNTSRHEEISDSEQRPLYTSLQESYLNTGSVYVHWPYCKQRCSYCNFVKFIPRPNSFWTIQDSILEDALVKELQHILQNSYISTVQSVFFGGGTPSLARPQMVEKILRAIQENCHLNENAEITLEVNPTSIETRKLQDFKALGGINRVSIGVQTLDETSLRLFNRDHSVKEAMHCIGVARQLFPGRVSMDIIFGRPSQTTESWVQELKEVLSFSDNHISLYQLTVERGTKLFQQIKSGEVIVPCADLVADLYETAVSLLEDSGFKRYEVSNFARGCFAESLHNKAYWRGCQYIGIGPGAHSRIVPRIISEENSAVHNLCTVSNFKYDVNFKSSDGCGGSTVKHESNLKDSLFNSSMIREARVNAADPASWLKEVKLKGTGIRKSTTQTPFDVSSEYVASGLRTSEGITALRWNTFIPHISLWEVFHDRTLWLQECNLLQMSSEGMKATSHGLNVLDSILPFLLNISAERLT
ncbi:radical S-adenosyl methionine domain-containing protein 1, mitochondrial-like isoform X2 [Panulirus ornatus]|uniref:radical S-adenosyl methionine domain-containing protein 1, mitochondrial-like isoform X2 n=1 Tax=Panulirus ornatus TaxID=150431 RepID=UPI003A87F3E0